MFSTDRSVFSGDSKVLERLREQASLVSELYVVVLTPEGEIYKNANEGKHLHLYPTRSRGKWSYLPDAYTIGRAILGKDDRDKWLITTQDPFLLGALGYLLSFIFRLPLHVQLHTDPWSSGWRGEHLLNRLRYVLAMFLFARADGIRVVSERLRVALMRRGVSPAKITRVPIYVDTEYFRMTPPSFSLRASYPEFSHIILSIGRLTREKNFDGLIRAMREVRKTHPDAGLLIVGSGPEADALRLLASSLGILDSVRILPWARDVVSYYKGSDVYVQPSRYEGWGMAVVEAMASGTPVVMTDVGCAGELVRDGETGMVVSVGDVRQLASVLAELLSDKELRRGLAQRASLAVQKLATKAETLMLYKESWDKAFAGGSSPSAKKGRSVEKTHHKKHEARKH